MQVEIHEAHIQPVIMALAHLAIERPGWDSMCKEIVVNMDGGEALYEEFKTLHKSENLETQEVWAIFSGGYPGGLEGPFVEVETEDGVGVKVEWSHTVTSSEGSRWKLGPFLVPVAVDE